MRNYGALDFAGGNVVHMSSGVAGLVAAMYLGRRKDYDKMPLSGHNVPMILMGTGLLWFGWFGFNAGSSLAANGLAANAFLVTNTAAAAASLAWIMMERLRGHRPTLTGGCTGAVVGLVSITPAAGFVGPLASIVIGFIGGMLCYTAIAMVKAKAGYDDALDAFGAHGVGGMWGALATGLFASKAINEVGANGLFFGNPQQLVIQAASVLATVAFAAVGTLVILFVVDRVLGLRVAPHVEEEGLDRHLHSEDAYPETVAPDSLEGLLGAPKAGVGAAGAAYRM